MEEINQIQSSKEFFYVIFQGNYQKNRVSAWIDGDKYARWFSFKDFEVLLKNNGQDQNIHIFREAMLTYSFFLWDVMNERCIQLHASKAEDLINLRDELNKSPTKKQESKDFIVSALNSSLTEEMWNADILGDKLKITKKDKEDKSFLVS